MVTDPLLIQAELRAGKTPEALCQEFSLEPPKRHGKHPNLVQFKYNQIASDMSLPLVQQCRGIILDEADDWRCVARPFDKFFNAEEPHAHSLDWQTAQAWEKVDGSLLILYRYHDEKAFLGEWLVATSGRPDASGNVNGMAMTFEELFWKTFHDQGMQVPDQESYQDLTFMFELTSPYNRVVCDYGAKPKLTLIGVRNRSSGHEEDPRGWEMMFNGWRALRPILQLGTATLQSLQATFASLDPMKSEGYVVVDRLWRRVKVKHPGYVLAHQLRSSFSTRNALEAIRRGEAPEILAHFPEMKAEMDRIEQALAGLVAKLTEEYRSLADVPLTAAYQKEFALRATKMTLGGAPHFALRSGRVKSFAEYAANMQIDRLIEALGLKGIDTAPPTPLE